MMVACDWDMTEGLDGRPLEPPEAVIWIPAPVGMISDHFYFHEAACNHCGRIPSVEAVQNTGRWIEPVREALGNRPIIVNSWCRCNVWNAQVGGAPNSYHLKGWALDVVVDGLTPYETWKACGKLQRIGLVGGVGRYPSFTHLDRGPRRNWVGP